MVAVDGADYDDLIVRCLNFFVMRGGNQNFFPRQRLDETVVGFRKFSHRGNDENQILLGRFFQLVMSVRRSDNVDQFPARIASICSRR